MLSSKFPNLPQPSPEHGHWSANLFRAHQQISAACAHADILLNQDECDPLRLKVHLEKLTEDCLPLLEAMEMNEYDLLPKDWITEAVESLAHRVIDLHKVCTMAKQRYVLNSWCYYQNNCVCVSREGHNVSQIEPITLKHSGNRGPPRKVVNPLWLHEAISPRRNISLTHLAKILGIHRHTLRNYMKHNNVTREFANLSQHDLDLLVKVCK